MLGIKQRREVLEEKEKLLDKAMELIEQSQDHLSSHEKQILKYAEITEEMANLAKRLQLRVDQSHELLIKYEEKIQKMDKQISEAQELFAVILKK